VHRGIWLVAFEGVPDRTGAESLRGTRLFVDASEGLPEDDDEGWYEDELAGLAAVTVDGQEVGTVTALQTRAAQDLLVVRLAAGGEALVPFVDSIVPVVDIPGGRVVLDPPPGLLELAAE
jgi:16S rRNA processing protein RimM